MGAAIFIKGNCSPSDFHWLEHGLCCSLYVELGLPVEHGQFWLARAPAVCRARAACRAWAILIGLEHRLCVELGLLAEHEQFWLAGARVVCRARAACNKQFTSVNIIIILIFQHNLSLWFSNSCGQQLGQLVEVKSERSSSCSSSWSEELLGLYA